MVQEDDTIHMDMGLTQNMVRIGHHKDEEKKHDDGLGSSKLNDAKGETKQEKTDRILTRSVLFYQEQEQDAIKDGMLGKKGDDDLKGAVGR